MTDDDNKPISKWAALRWASAQGPLALVGYSIAALFACAATGLGLVIVSFAYSVAFGCHQ